MQRKRSLEDDLVGRLKGIGLTSTDVAKVTEIFGELDVQIKRQSRLNCQRSLLRLFDELAQNICLNVDGEVFEWETLSPQLLLTHMLDNSPFLHKSYAAAIAARPPSRDAPWHLILVFDEFVPGNKLAVDNRRKELTIAYNFAELGLQVLEKSASWLVPAVLRHTVLATCDGGCSNCLRLMLRQLLFEGPQGFEHGYPINVGGAIVVIFAELFVVLSDSDGIRMALDWRGYNSLRPCFRCDSVFKIGSDLASRAGGVEIDSTDHDAFGQRTSADLFRDFDIVLDAAQRYSDNLLTKTKFEKVVKAVGFNPNPLGLLADLDLRDRIDWVQVVCHDWMHGYLSDGTLVQEVLLLV